MSENEDPCIELKERLAALEVVTGLTKEPQFSTRDLADMEKKDWRGVLAVMVTAGFFGTVLLTMLYRPTLITEILTLNTLVLMALQFYFTVKQNAN